MRLSCKSNRRVGTPVLEVASVRAMVRAGYPGWEASKNVSSMWRRRFTLRVVAWLEAQLSLMSAPMLYQPQETASTTIHRDLLGFDSSSHRSEKFQPYIFVENTRKPRTHNYSSLKHFPRSSMFKFVVKALSVFAAVAGIVVAESHTVKVRALRFPVTVARFAARCFICFTRTISRFSDEPYQETVCIEPTG